MHAAAAGGILGLEAETCQLHSCGGPVVEFEQLSVIRTSEFNCTVWEEIYLTFP
jgi:hypothetical protein